MAFRARNPRLSSCVSVNLHINFEVQKDYRPGYPIEKRGMYYLARSLGSQLGLVTERADYGQLEKCYSVWICRERMERFIDFSGNLELKKEVTDMGGWGLSILEEGLAKGKAEGILELLGDIGSVPEELSKRIGEEADIEKLRRWLKLAARAESVEQFMEVM